MTEVRNKKRINRLNVALSVLVAFGTWFYVVTDISPNITRTFNDVQIECEGLDQLAAEGTGVESMSVETVRVTVKLDRTEVADTTSDDFRAVIDVSDAIRGENECDVKIYAPTGQRILSQSVEKVVVKVTDSLNHDVPVTAIFKDNQDASREPLIKSLSSDYVSVMGAVSQSEQVAYVALYVDTITAGAEDEKNAYIGNMVGKPVAYDANGRVVKHIVIRPETIEVSYYAGSVVTQMINVKVEGDTENYTYELPKSVVIKGEPKVIGQITGIEATLDLTGITEDCEVPLKYDLPKGVALANKSLTSKVAVKVKK